MAASFPTSIKSFPTLVDGIDSVLALHQNERAAEIVAIETELGVNPSGTVADVAARLTAIETSVADLQYGDTPKKIVPTVASNNLSVAVKHIDDSAPSATNPLKFLVGTTYYLATAAISFTLNAGTNWCALGGPMFATIEQDVFLYAIGESGASAGLKFGISRLPYAESMADFVNTNTNEKYIAGNWTNFNATDPVSNIGRFAVTLSATAAFNWSVPTYTPSGLIHRRITYTRVLAFTPQWTNLTVGNATNIGLYFIIGRQVFYQIALTWGSGTSSSGQNIWATPFTRVGTTAANINPNGMIRIYDTSAGTSFAGLVYWWTSASIDAAFAQSISGTYLAVAGVTNTVPMTWATGDALFTSVMSFFL